MLRKRHDSILLRSAGERTLDGHRARISAATPATCGDAIDVPSSPTQNPLPAQGKLGLVGVPKLNCREQTEMTNDWVGHPVRKSPPGAEMSMLGTDPRFE
jgi:hypothetical protein